MPYATHDTISDAFFLYDDADEPILGAVAGDFATIEAYALPHGTPTAAVTLTETGGGGYAVSFVPTTLAMWTVHVVYDVPPVFRDYSLSYLVDATGTATGVAVVGPTTTRQDLARLIGRRLRELILLTATSDGTDVSFVDANTLRGPDLIYRGRDIYFPTTGEQRRVNNSTQATSRITWGTAVTASTLTGARAELWNEDSQGVDRTMVNDAIDQALVYAQSNFWIPVVADVGDGVRPRGRPDRDSRRDHPRRLRRALPRRGGRRAPDRPRRHQQRLGVECPQGGGHDPGRR